MNPDTTPLSVFYMEALSLEPTNDHQRMLQVQVQDHLDGLAILDAMFYGLTATDCHELEK